MQISRIRIGRRRFTGYVLWLNIYPMNLREEDMVFLYKKSTW